MQEKPETKIPNLYMSYWIFPSSTIPLGRVLGLDDYGKRSLPFAASPVYLAGFKYMEKITSGDAKPCYKLGLQPEKGWEYAPGDTIGILVSNRADLVESIVQRLNLKERADIGCRISLNKINAKIGRKCTFPKHLPEFSTLREVFLNLVDIESPPKKLFLRALASYTTNESEKETLLLMSTPKGSDSYSELIKGPGRTLLGLLDHFPSCKPPVEIILEHLPPLFPRPYSISSAPCRKDVLEITFSLAFHDNGTKGLCTGWLQNLPMDDGPIPIYLRQPSTSFRLDSFLTDYVILIATGTGIGPFRALLEERYLQKRQSGLQFWLIYGCRHPDKDFLYKEDIHEYLKDGIIYKLDVAFSSIARNCEKSNCYVQDVLRNNSEKVFRWIFNRGAQVFICGNARMIGQVKSALVRVFAEGGPMDPSDAEDYLKNMTETKRCNIDSWY